MPPIRSFSALGLFVREGFLDERECHRIAAEMLSDAGDHATVFGDSSDGAIAADVRRAWDVNVTAEHQLLIAKRLRDVRPELEAHFQVALGDADAPSFVRYPEGAFYRPHRDRRETPDPSHAERRAVSVVVFVNGPRSEAAFAGGRLRFYGLLGEGPLAELGIDAEPAAGALIAFRSTLEHEVTTVESGTRLSIVTWFPDRVSGR